MEVLSISDSNEDETAIDNNEFEQSDVPYYLINKIHFRGELSFHSKYVL